MENGQSLDRQGFDTKSSLQQTSACLLAWSLGIRRALERGKVGRWSARFSEWGDFERMHESGTFGEAILLAFEKHTDMAEKNFQIRLE